MRYLLLIPFLLMACASVPAGPVEYSCKIVREYPHNPQSYTQGLFWANGDLYESTGEYGRSALKKIDLETGETLRETTLDARYFGEGATYLNGSIYVLTWREGKCFVYDDLSLTLEREFTYTGEGWGLTTDGGQDYDDGYRAYLYMSDGSANITVRDPYTFEAVRTIAVRKAGRPVGLLNELEWIDGKIWANVYMSTDIVIIDPISGNVEGVVDCSSLLSRLTLTPETDVMNGIAYHPGSVGPDNEGPRIFVTGKNWDKLFEIEIFSK